jgi:hypothetical protein
MREIEELFKLAKREMEALKAGKRPYDYVGFLRSNWPPLQKGKYAKTTKWTIDDVSNLRCVSVRILLMNRPFTTLKFGLVTCESFRELLEQGGVLIDISSGVLITRHVVPHTETQRNEFEDHILKPWRIKGKCGGTINVHVGSVRVRGLFAFVPKQPPGKSLTSLRY